MRAAWAFGVSIAGLVASATASTSRAQCPGTSQSQSGWELIPGDFPNSDIDQLLKQPDIVVPASDQCDCADQCAAKGTDQTDPTQFATTGCSFFSWNVSNRTCTLRSLPWRQNTTTVFAVQDGPGVVLNYQDITAVYENVQPPLAFDVDGYNPIANVGSVQDCVGRCKGVASCAASNYRVADYACFLKKIDIESNILTGVRNGMVGANADDTTTTGSWKAGLAGGLAVAMLVTTALLAYCMCRRRRRSRRLKKGSQSDAEMHALSRRSSVTSSSVADLPAEAVSYADYMGNLANPRPARGDGERPRPRPRAESPQVPETAKQPTSSTQQPSVDPPEDDDVPPPMYKQFSSLHRPHVGGGSSSGPSSSSSEATESVVLPPRNESTLDHDQVQDDGVDAHFMDYVHLAKRTHTPARPDELAVHVGDSMVVQRLWGDGWATALNTTTGHEGVVPLAVLGMSEAPADSGSTPSGESGGREKTKGEAVLAVDSASA
ncbi:hypothetical protein HKX48_007606 [Thoreauomyces humboldtii]|nr:hypothetical protein HKX48_007606 [Thoreauomyces humboldtii]